MLANVGTSLLIALDTEIAERDCDEAQGNSDDAHYANKEMHDEDDFGG